MLTLLDVEGFPKKSLKNKSIVLLRAFVLTDDDDQMQVNPTIDLFAIDEVSAIERMINNDLSEDQRESFFKDVNEGRLRHPKDNSLPLVISFASFKVLTKDMISKELVKASDDIYFRDNILSVCISDKEYTLDVYDRRITDLKLERQEDTWTFKVTELELEDV